jgi:tetratricopeptide (TPR) repeat protein
MAGIDELFAMEKNAIAQLPLAAKKDQASFVEALISLMSLYLDILETDCANQDALSRCFRVTFLFRPKTFTEKQAAVLTKVNSHYHQLITSGSKDASCLLAFCRSLAICHGPNTSQVIAGLAAQAIELGDDSTMAQAYVIMANLLAGQNNLEGAVKMYRLALDRDPLCVDALFALGMMAHDKQLLDKAVQIDPSHIQAVVAGLH